MKFIKRAFPLVLAGIVALTICGCHKKDEVAVKIGDVEFTSGYYLCAMITADQEARQKIDELAATDDKIQIDDGSDYYKQKIDKKDFSKYVKEQTLDKLKMIAAYEIKCKENKLDAEKDSTYETYKQYADYYWETYDYAKIYEPNGVGKETFAKYSADEYYSECYFESIYGKEGKTPVAEDEISKYMNENFAVADQIDVDFSNMESINIDEAKSDLNRYCEEIKKGNMTFGDAYCDYYGEEPKETTEGGPKDPYATLFGTKDTTAENVNYDSVKEMAVGEVKLITKDNDLGMTLLIRLDINEDSYYLTSLDTEIRHNLKDKEFEKEIEKFAKTLKVKEYTKATDRFKPKNIEYPENNTSSETPVSTEQ